MNNAVESFSGIRDAFAITLCPFFWKNSKYNFFSLSELTNQITIVEIVHQSKAAYVNGRDVDNPVASGYGSLKLALGFDLEETWERA